MGIGGDRKPSRFGTHISTGECAGAGMTATVAVASIACDWTSSSADFAGGVVAFVLLQKSWQLALAKLP